jgi:hypothetical protein
MPKIDLLPCPFCGEKEAINALPYVTDSEYPKLAEDAILALIQEPRT